MRVFRNFTRGLLRHSRPIGSPRPTIDCTVCIDIECTCDHPLQIEPMEVIEIACLKLDLESKQASRDREQLMKCPVFHRFVRPLINPELTLFCQDLTGIRQKTVDQAESIDIVTGQLMSWLVDQDLIDGSTYAKKRNFAFASCGNFDVKLLSPLITRFLLKEKHDLPIYFKEWINVKKTFVNHKKEWPQNLYHMLELLDEEPFGRLHSAMDDCRNLANIVRHLHHDGCDFHINSKG